MKPWSPASQADSLPFELQGSVFIYLAASGLSCVMRALQLWHVGSVVVVGPASQRTCIVAQSVKNLPAMQETWVRFLGREDPLEKEMATHSIILTWKIPWTEEPVRVQTMGSQELDTT